MFDTNGPADHDLISEVEVSKELGFLGGERGSSFIVYSSFMKICFIFLSKGEIIS